MFKRRNRIMGLIGLTVLILLGVGLYLAHKNYEFQNEMFRIVHSEEVKELIEEDLRRKDPYALTENGKIHSYKVDDSSIKHNPMGGLCLILSLMMTLILLGQQALENMGRMRQYKLLVWIGQKVFRSY